MQWKLALPRDQIVVRDSSPPTSTHRHLNLPCVAMEPWGVDNEYNWKPALMVRIPEKWRPQGENSRGEEENA